ncbi:MAG: UDP-2,3-diacylglucosamine diphosphatase LpxI [Holosporales bacterium]|jgi:DUF1009 family protein|nr:UDP-2,3-diacylglucosamine diphosphatase LpxI [Holosporales bacterium]
MGKIAIIAGSGDLPSKVSNQLDLIGRSYEIIPISEGSSFCLGQIGAILKHIKSIGATEVILCGGVKRPSLFKLKLDEVGKKWVKKLGYRVFLGDDALLKGIKRLLAAEGLEILGPQSILQSLLSPAGLLTVRKPSEQDIFDIARGMFVLNSISKADIGQSVVVQEGVVIAVEAIEGTRNMILRSKALKIAENGGVLVKNSKIAQSPDMDLPTIGKETVLECKESGLHGIAVGAGATQIIDLESTKKLANENDIFIIGI